MIPNFDTDYLTTLANTATTALLEQKNVTVTRSAKEPRDSFPLPIKRMPENSDGFITQDYRPLAILEYVHEVLSGVIISDRLKERKKKNG